MDVSLSVGHGLEDLSVAPADASQLLRIVDEALANATRHGAANVVHVTLDTDTDARVLALAIADDGAGFDAAALQHAGDDHYGLRFMRQRAEGLGGSLEISSAPGSGTTLIVRVPHEVNAEVGSK
jgi:signal transduction histidine kinase